MRTTQEAVLAALAASPYVKPQDRFIVVYVVGYSEQDTVGSREDAIGAAESLIGEGAHCAVFDRKLGCVSFHHSDRTVKA